MPQARPPRSLALSVTSFACAALVVLAPLLRGSVDLPVESFILVVASTGALCALVRHPLLSKHALALFAVLVWMLLQLVPAPPWIHAWSPQTASLFELTLAELGRYPANRPVALDLPGAYRETAKAIACLLLVVSSASLADTHRRRAALLRFLGASPVAVAVVVLGAALLGQGPLLVPVLPFVNPNHLAGFLASTGFVTLGHAVRSSGRSRVLWALGFVAVTAVVMASLSRSGILIFGVGLLAFAAWCWRGAAAAPGTRPILLGSAVLGVAAGAWLALTPMLAELGTLDPTATTSKVRLWPAGLRLVHDFPLTGIGRGAFANVFQSYRTDSAPVVFTHLENEWLQALIDLGVPFGILLLVTVGSLWVRAARRRPSSPQEVGLLVGMACVALHCLFDFSLEILGVAVPFSIGLGLLMAGGRRVRVPKNVLLPAVGALMVLGLALQLGHRREDRALASLSSAPVDGLLARAPGVVEDRPADYLPHVVVGAGLVNAERCPGALPWLRRAMLLAPTVPEPHALVGRCLATMAGGAREARREYGLAVSLGMTGALAEASRFWSSLDDLYAIAGDTPEGLLALSRALTPERPLEAQRVLTRLQEEFREDRALPPLARLALRNGDYQAALSASRLWSAVSPTEVEAYALAASALDAGSRREEARRELARGLAAVPGSAELIGLLSAWAVQERDFAEARELALQIRLRTARDLSTRHVLLAKALVAQGRVSEAIAELESAAVNDPQDAGLLHFLASLQEREGRIREAIATVERAAALPGSPPGAYSTELKRLRGALQPLDPSAPPSSPP